MPIRVAQGDILTVTADAGSYGTVWSLDGSNHQWSVGAKSPLRLGAGLYRIETVKGSVSHSVQSAAMTALEATLPRATAIVGSAATVARAIGDTMSLQDKFARLAERAKSVPAALAQRADASLARLDAVEARSTVFDKLDAIATDAEQSVQVAEDAVNQLTNSAPM